MASGEAGSSGPVHLPLRFRDRRLRTRTLDERLAVHFPSLLRFLAKRVLKLPAASRARRYLFVRRVCQGYQAVNRGDLDVLLAAYHEDATISFDSASGLVPPDIAGEYHGHPGFRALWDGWRSAWDELHLEPTELYDLGDGMLVKVRMTGTGRGSGAPTTMDYYEVYSFRDGIIGSHANYFDRGEAFAVAGVHE